MTERDDLAALVVNPVPFLVHEDPVLRRMATTALTEEQSRVNFEAIVVLLGDGEPSVRAAAAEKLGVCGPRALDALGSAQRDAEPKVREAVATAYGELGSSETLKWLIEVTRDDPDRTVTEAAVAALGAIGDDRAVDPLLDFVASGPPQTRRRAIAAITVYDDPRIEPALRRAALDRNPGVREAAEMIVGRQSIGTTTDRRLPTRDEEMTTTDYRQER